MIKENSIVRHNSSARVYFVADTSHNGARLYIQPLNCGGRSIGKFISTVSPEDVKPLAEISFEKSGNVWRWQVKSEVFSGGGLCATKKDALNDATIYVASVFPC